ncbi:MAG: TonB-dependent receptor domain-containing protein [Cyanophyceae cyanobacterium]
MLNQLQRLLVITGTLSAATILVTTARADANDGGAVTPARSQPALSAEELPITSLETLQEEVLTGDAAQLTAQAIPITDVQVQDTGNGVSITIVSDQPVTPGQSSISGNAFIVDIPGATLSLTNADAAEQFAPADGISLVQVSATPDGGVRIAITGSDGPPEVNISPSQGGLVLTAIPGDAVASDADPDALQLVVTATRTEEDIADVPRSVTVISREQIQQQLSFNNNLTNILGKLIPGLAPPPFTNDTSQLELRGRPIVVLIDGVPQTPNSNGNAADLRVIDPALVERIEVLRGPSAIYGDGGTGGIINIITRSPTNESVAFNFEAGTTTSLDPFGDDSFGYNLVAGVSGSGERLDGLLSLSVDSVNSLFDAEGDRIIPTNDTDTDRFGLLAKLGYNFSDTQRLELTYSYFRDSLDTEFLPDESVVEIPGLQKGRALRIGDIDYEDEPQQVNHVVNLTYRNENVFGSQLDFQAYFRDRLLIQRLTDLRLNSFFLDNELFSPFPDVWQTGLEATEWGGRLQLDSPIGNTLSVLWGVDYTNERNDRPLRVADNDDFDNNQEINIVDDSLTQGGPYDVESVGLFAQGTWEISEQFQLSGGVRYENIDVSVEDYRLAFITTNELPRDRQGGEANFDDVAFNAGLIYSPTPELSLFANFSQGFSIPNVGGILNSGPDFDVSSDLRLEPQKVDNYEIGIRGDFGRVQASLTGFYNASDLGTRIAIDDEGFGRVVRAPQRNYGVEATVDWQPSDIWRLGGYVSWNEGDDDIDDDGDFEPSSNVNIKPIKFGAYVENNTTPNWTNRLELLAVGGRDRSFDEEIDDDNLDGYITLDFLSTLKLSDESTLSLGISNLLNEQYLPVATQVLTNAGVESRRAAAPGRRVSLRFRIEF